jgi:hypothetical protein
MEVNKSASGKSENQLSENKGKSPAEKLNIEAHDEALSDIEEDPDFSAGTPNDDLDEGETARLGEDKTDLA